MFKFRLQRGKNKMTCKAWAWHMLLYSKIEYYKYVETKHRASVWLAYSDSNAQAEHQGQWSKVNGGLWTRGGGRTRIRRGGRGRTSERCHLPFFTICHGWAQRMIWLGWDESFCKAEVSVRGRKIPTHPIQCIHFWVFQNNDSKEEINLFRNGRKGKLMDSCSAGK